MIIFGLQASVYIYLLFLAIYTPFLVNLNMSIIVTDNDIYLVETFGSERLTGILMDWLRHRYHILDYAGDILSTM